MSTGEILLIEDNPRQRRADQLHAAQQRNRQQHLPHQRDRTPPLKHAARPPSFDRRFTVSIGDETTAADAHRATASRTRNSAARSLGGGDQQHRGQVIDCPSKPNGAGWIMSWPSSTVRSRGDQAEGEISCTRA